LSHEGGISRGTKALRLQSGHFRASNSAGESVTLLESMTIRLLQAPQIPQFVEP
jgi:hypothetical protein